jgi:gliding motility-associated-like protein
MKNVAFLGRHILLPSPLGEGLGVRLLFLFLSLASLATAQIQNPNTITNGDTIRHYNCLVDNGNVMFSDVSTDESPFDSWVILYLNNWDGFVSINGSYSLQNFNSFVNLPNDYYIDVYLDSTLTHHFDGNSPPSPISTNYDSITIHVHFDSVHRPYENSTLHKVFHLTWNTPGSDSICGLMPIAFYVDWANETSVGVSWLGDAGTWELTCNGQTYTDTTNQCVISGLEANTRYVVTLKRQGLSDCCSSSYTIYTQTLACQGVPDLTDLYSYYSRGYYGPFVNPYGNVGIIDAQSSSIYSRHTVHTDVNETDINTGNHLHTVCPGMQRSVRLGNSLTGAQAEALTYRILVDTTFYSLMLLRYAVLLQDPDHVAKDQPRFKLEIIDSTNHVIDSRCGYADFMSNSQLGWHSYYASATPTLWKDWTTMGFDLSAYHGQKVTLRLTTYDCAQGGHFGYAYFNAEFIHASAESFTCGPFDTNTISAPDGFKYEWFWGDDPTNIISTSRTTTYSYSNRYLFCRLISTEDSSCVVTMHTYGGTRLPHAVIDTLSTVDHGCDGTEVIFINNSYVSAEGNVPLDYNENCEGAIWYFGDGANSTQYNPNHIYHQGGDYTVTLISTLADGLCRDTTTFTLSLPDNVVNDTIPRTVCDSIRWVDGITYSTDTIGPSVLISNPYGCDTLHILDLHIVHAPTTTLPADTFCYSSTYSWRGQTTGHNGYDLQADAHLRLVDKIPNGQFCDSAVVLPLVQLAPDRAVFITESDCNSKRYTLSSTSTRPSFFWDSQPFDSLLIGQQELHEVHVSPQVSTNYVLVTDYDTTTSISCPTSLGISLEPVTFPRAQLHVNPNQLTYQQQQLSAHDLSAKYGHRRWTIVSHFPNLPPDSLPLQDTNSHITYRTSSDIDSLTVMLAVSNGLCRDTATATIPMVRQAIFAPNTFTPDQATNSRFVIVGQGVIEAQLDIYNRLGLHVFSTANLDEGWDGTHNGSPCPQGAYVWHLRYRAIDLPDNWRTATGTVTLIR